MGMEAKRQDYSTERAKDSTGGTFAHFHGTEGRCTMIGTEGPTRAQHNNAMNYL